MTIEIREVIEFSDADQRSIRRLIERVGWNDAQAEGQVQSIARFLRDEDAAVFFAADEGKICAFITCQFTAWNRLGQIHGLVVDPGSRRQNLATRLVERAEQYLRSKGARGVYVDTPVDNAVGRRFYEALGYQPSYIMPEYYDAGKDGVTYQKFFR